MRRAVGVQVVEDDQAGTGSSRAGEYSPLQRGKLLRPPLVVHRIEAEVDDVRTRADRGREARVGGIPADHAGARESAFAVAVDRDDIVALDHDLLDERVADLPVPEDDGPSHQLRFSVVGALARRPGSARCPPARVRAVAVMGICDSSILGIA